MATPPTPDPQPLPATAAAEPGPAQTPPGVRLVRLALIFYAAMLALAALLAWWGETSLLFADARAASRGVDPWRDPAAGALAAAMAIALSRGIVGATRWGEALARSLGALIGRRPNRDYLVLALASGLAEEALFRGVLQPRIGLVAASLVFGLAHFAPRRELLPWTAFSVLAGFLLGGLYAWTGNLVAPVVAHVGINAVNLRHLGRHYAPRPSG